MLNSKIPAVIMIWLISKILFGPNVAAQFGFSVGFIGVKPIARIVDVKVP
jgi:hypothetical protein